MLRIQRQFTVFREYPDRFGYLNQWGYYPILFKNNVRTKFASPKYRRLLPLIKIPSLTGVRFIAAAMVFLSHFPMQRIAEPIYPIAEQGYSGVTLFFVLSGFVLSLNYFDRFLKCDAATICSFSVARIARIFPLYWLSILFAWCITNSSQTNLLPFLFGFQAWHLYSGPDVNPPAWSVSVELFLYGTFPILMLLAHRLNFDKIKQRLNVALASTAIGLLLITLYFCLSQQRTVPIPDKNSAHAWLYGFPLTRVFDFALGVVSGIWYLKHFPSSLISPRTWSYLTYCSTLVLLLILGWPYHYLSPFSWDLSFAITGLLIIVSLAANPKTWISRFLASRMMVLLGECSYAFYLFHFSLASLYRDRTESALQDFGNYFFFFGLTVALAYGLHKLIELPAKKFVLKLVSTW